MNYLKAGLADGKIVSIKITGTKEIAFARVGFEPDIEWPDKGMYLNVLLEEGEYKVSHASYSLTQICF